MAEEPILHIGSDFDDFLREENFLDVSEATAAKRVIAFQIAQEMPTPRISYTLGVCIEVERRSPCTVLNAAVSTGKALSSARTVESP